MLSREQVAERIVAARKVRGYEQDELAELLVEQSGGEFRKSYLGRIERRDVELTPGRRQMLAQALRIPEHWFTAKDPFASLDSGPGNLEERVRLLEERLNDLIDAFAQGEIEQALAEVGELAPRGRGENAGTGRRAASRRAKR